MQVIDNFFPENMFKELQKKILGSGMPFFYVPNISVPKEMMVVGDPLAKETDAFTQHMYDKENKISSDDYINLKPYFMYLVHKLGYVEENITRVRCVNTWPKPGMTSEHYNIPHVDNPTEHKSVILYMNDSDGDTRLFHQKQTPLNWRIRHDATEEEKEIYASQFIRTGFTVEHTVTPKANRVLIFDGLTYHTAGFPVNTNRRVIININISEFYQKVFE